MSGAERGNRTPDARAFNAPLYLLSYLGNLIWRLVRESNPRLPARQAGTLATELTKQNSIRSRVPAPPTRCGRFPPRSVSFDEGSFCWRRVRDSNPRVHLERVVSWAV